MLSKRPQLYGKQKVGKVSSTRSPTTFLLFLFLGFMIDPLPRLEWPRWKRPAFTPQSFVLEFSGKRPLGAPRHRNLQAQLGQSLETSWETFLKTCHELSRDPTIDGLSIQHGLATLLRVNITWRHPRLLVEEEGQRFLISSALEIYEASQGVPPGVTRLQGLLTGAFLRELPSSPHFLPRKERGLLQESLDLLKQIEGLFEDLDALQWQPYRGWVALRTNGTQIIFGRAPFASKLRKLETLAQRRGNLQARRIELDYPGKAFIEEFHL